MIKNDTNNVFNDQETQDPLIREKLLFEKIQFTIESVDKKRIKNHK